MVPKSYPLDLDLDTGRRGKNDEFKIQGQKILEFFWNDFWKGYIFL